MWKTIIGILAFRWVKQTFPDKVLYIIMGVGILAILVILSDLSDLIKTKLVKRGVLSQETLVNRNPRLGIIVLIVTIIISFFLCIVVKKVF